MSTSTQPDTDEKIDFTDLENDICAIARLAVATDTVARYLLGALEKASERPVAMALAWPMTRDERELLEVQIDDLRSKTVQLRERFYEAMS